MAPNNDYATKLELLQMKGEIVKEQTASRHSQANLFQSSIASMDEKIDKLADKMEAGFEKVFNKFDELPGKFVSRDEHADNKKRIEELENENKEIRKNYDKMDGKLAMLGFVLPLIAALLAFLWQAVWDKVFG